MEAVNILVECPELIASVRVGVLEPLKLLEKQNKCKVRFLKTVSITKADIAWCDILVCVRGAEASTLNIVNAAKITGRFIIYYLDDDLLNIPQGSLTTAYYSDTKTKEILVEIIKSSDLLWGVNDLIGAKYKKYCNNKWVMNKVPVNILNCSFPKSTDGCNILYAGSMDHQAVVQEYLSPVARSLCEEFGNKISFTFIGADPGITNIQNIHYVKFLESYDEYKKIVQNGNFCIGLAPINTSEFYRCKYYNKFIEYTSINAMGIYTNTEPYTLIVKNEGNGFLCENTFEGWHQSIKKAILNDNLRNACIFNARQQLQKEFSPEAVGNQLEKDIPQLTQFHAPEVKLAKVPLKNMVIAFYKARASYLWKTYRFASIPIMLFKAVKKLLKWASKEIKNIVQRLF